MHGSDLIGIAPGSTEVVERCLCGASALTSRQVLSRDEISGRLFNYQQCAACGLERIVHRPDITAISEYYPQNYYAYGGPVEYKRSLSDWVKWLVYRVFYADAAERTVAERYLRWPLAAVLYPIRFRTILAFRQPETRRVFELGAAIGNDLMQFRLAGWEVAGCEPSEKASNIARQRGIEIQNCGAEAAVLDAGRFSCVLMNNVFEHLHEPAEVLDKARAGLTPDGVLVLIVPNHASWTARVFGASWPGYDPPRHLWGFTPASIQKLLASKGFKVEYIHHIAPQRWCWVGTLAGTRMPSGATPGRVLASNLLAPLMLPLGLIAATFGHGDFMKVVSRTAIADDKTHSTT